MAGCPILICKKCGYAKRSAFDISGSTNSSVTGCAEQCPGCGIMLGTPDMFSGSNPGQLKIINRDDNVVTILVNVVANYNDSGNVDLSTYEYSKLPDWARGLVDLARAYPKLAGAAMALLGILVVRFADLGQSSIEQNWSTESAKLLQDRQQLLDIEKIKLQDRLERERSESNDKKNDSLYAVEKQWVRVLDAHERAARELADLSSGDPIIHDDLLDLLTEYNDTLREIYELINSTNRALSCKQSIANKLPQNIVEYKQRIEIMNITDIAGKPISLSPQE